MKDLLKIFQMVTDFVYFPPFKHAYYKGGKIPHLLNLCDEKILFFFFFNHKKEWIKWKYIKTKTLQNPFLYETKMSQMLATKNIYFVVCGM